MNKRLAAMLSALLAAAQPIGSPAQTPVTLDMLSPEHGHQLHCTMLAGLIVHEHDRGVRQDSEGLAEADVERLGEALAATLEPAYGADAETTRALLKQEFESFAATFVESPDAGSDAQLAVFEEAVSGCRALWSGPTPLPPAPSYNGKPVDALFCFALNSVFSSATYMQAGSDTPISIEFARRANRFEAGLVEKAGDDAAALRAADDAMLAAIDTFDTPAWDALAEPEAEKIMSWCEKLAGPDE